MPSKDSYSDRVFTTEVVSYPDIVHVGEDKNFSVVINKDWWSPSHYGYGTV